MCVAQTCLSMLRIQPNADIQTMLCLTSVLCVGTVTSHLLPSELRSLTGGKYVLRTVFFLSYTSVIVTRLPAGPEWREATEVGRLPWQQKRPLLLDVQQWPAADRS